ncbi:MAG: VUT family protein [Actinomycetota bacterium]|jgi:hypothetical protein|nr:VUT family protein [Actinomycetota bacterium]
MKDAQEAYNTILGYAPRLLIAASFLAYLVDVFTNSIVISKMKVTAQIMLRAGACVNAEEVGRAFRDVQRQILKGGARPLPERTLEATTFVTRRIRKYGE